MDLDIHNIPRGSLTVVPFVLLHSGTVYLDLDIQICQVVTLALKSSSPSRWPAQGRCQCLVQA
jgi:hypothetical protein